MPHAEGIPTVDVQLGGKQYTLGWTWAAKRRARDFFIAQGKDSAAALREENLAVAFWAALDKETRSTTSVEDIEEMIHPKNEEYVATKIGSLFDVSEPAPDPNAHPVAANQPTTGDLNSKRSGQLESTISV